MTRGFFVMLWLATSISSTLAETKEKNGKHVETYFAPFKPISYKCPAENGNEIEFIKMNGEGFNVRTRGTYENSVLTRIIIQVSEPGGQFDSVLQGLPNETRSEKDNKKLNHAVAEAELVDKLICKNPDTSFRKRLDELYERNRAELKEEQKKYRH